ncbi:kinase-like domain-containing protein [Cristinia sonorae]|uniref:Kinase-like domain-containing protein n=1 Tax=Cristinia sonorae TaxID=1940300 RepID=A0A8K0XMV8_9AGAR|nr:kinase-like domain-containing protein [Cristinia sonorae]
MNISSAAHLLLDAQTPPASPLLLSPVVACADLSATLINIAPAVLGGVASDHVTEEKVAQIEDATTTEPVVAVPVAVLVGGEVVSCAEVTNAEVIPVTDAALPVEAANTPEVPEVVPGPVATDINVQVTEANKAAPALEEIAPVSRNEDEVPVSPVAEPEHGAPPCYTKSLSLEDFKIIKRLGSGGFGTVFAAVHKATGGACAIKVTERPSDGEGNADRMNEFTAGEQTAMLRMDGTPGVIELLGAWYDSKNVYNVMPLYAGDLTSELRYRRAFPEARVRFYAAELVQTLAALHEDKVVHRDIKPANLLTSEDGHVTVADLGLARSFLRGASDAEKMMCASYHEVDENDYGEMNEVTNSGCGTSTHMAPEVLNGQLYDYKADIWSMGITVFELVFGHVSVVFCSVAPPVYVPRQHPWPHVRTEPELVRAIIREGVKIDEKECIAKGVSEGMQAFLRQTLSMEPKSRPSAQQLMDHDMFYGIIWDELREFEVPASWRHGSGIKPDQTPPSIAHGTPIDPATDPFPFLTFQSQKLSQLPRHTAAVDDEQATTKAYVAPDTIDAAFSGFSMEPESDAPSFLWEVPVGPVVAPPAPLSNLNPFRDPSRPLNNNNAPAIQPASASLDPFRDPSHPLILKSIPAAQLPSLLHLDTFGPPPPADRDHQTQVRLWTHSEHSCSLPPSLAPPLLPPCHGWKRSDHSRRTRPSGGLSV